MTVCPPCRETLVVEVLDELMPLLDALNATDVDLDADTRAALDRVNVVVTRLLDAYDDGA